MKRLFLNIFFILMIVSCSPSTIPISDLPISATVPSISTALPIPTSLPSPSPTPDFPVHDGEILLPSTSVISKDNLSQLTELAVWGKGVIKNIMWSEDGKQILINTSTSVGWYSYDSASFQRKEKPIQVKEDKPKISFTMEDSGTGTDEFGRLKRQFLVHVTGSQSGSFYVNSIYPIGVSYLSESNTIIVNSGMGVELRDGTSYEIFDTFGGAAYKYNVAEDGSYSYIGDDYSALDVSKDQKTVAAGQFDGKIILRSGEEFANNLTLETKGPVRFLSFSPDGTKLLSESNGNISVWDVLNGKIIGTLTDTFISGDFFYDQYRFGSEAGLGVAAKENKIVYANRNFVIILDLLNGTRSILVDGGEGSLLDKQEDGKYGHPDYQPVTDVFFSADGQYLITVLEDRTYIWDISSNQFLKSMAQIEEKERYGSVAVYSPSDHLLLVGNAFSSYIRIWNVDDGSALPNIKAWKSNANQSQPDGTHSLTISPDGKYVFSWSGLEGVANLWEVKTQKRVMAINIAASEYSKYKPGFFPVAISPDNKKILFTYSLNPDSRTATAYSIPDGKELYRISEYYATFSPDGSVIAASVGNNKIRFYDSETGKQLGDVTSKYPNQDGFQLLYFSEDGKNLIAVSTNGTIGVWGIP